MQQVRVTDEQPQVNVHWADEPGLELELAELDCLRRTCSPELSLTACSQCNMVGTYTTGMHTPILAGLCRPADTMAAYSQKVFIGCTSILCSCTTTSSMSSSERGPVCICIQHPFNPRFLSSFTAARCTFHFAVHPPQNSGASWDMHMCESDHHAAAAP